METTRREFFGLAAGAVVGAVVAPELLAVPARSTLLSVPLSAITYSEYGLGFIVTDEMLLDDTYKRLADAAGPMATATRCALDERLF